MPFPPSSYGSGAGPNGASRGNYSRPGVSRPGSGATASLAIDNMLRNQLKVSNPRDPKQVAEGLLAFYQDLPQTAGIRQEAQGLPFLQAPSMPVLPPPQPTSSDAEFNIANSDVEKALQDLASNPLTNDITPEMQGWGESIRGAIAQGHAAARLGLDPTQRDKVIGVRRQLGEYGRMARFVGSLSPGMTQNFRRLGQAMDEMSAVLLVMLGESLASVGFASGYYLLQVPLAEVQQRRDAVIYALRNFMGGAQEAYGPDDWPRGIDAYRKLYEWLEQQGQGDLRSLLLENDIAQMMDALITRAQNGTPEGLRALGVTAQLDIERFRRMAIVAPGAMLLSNGHYDRSPPLESYVQALSLFAETFRPAGGLRLLRIARPPILFYGIYNPNLLEDDRDLVELIMLRGALATILDGLFPAAGARSVETQVLLDMLLLELDRGIDLLALGAKPKEKGPTEKRALAYWLIAQVIQLLLKTDPSWPSWPSGPLWTYLANHPADWTNIYDSYKAAQTQVPALRRAIDKIGTPPTKVPDPKSDPLLDFDDLKGVAEELLVQQSLEKRWQDLVRTVAPEAGDRESVFQLLDLVIKQAIFDANSLYGGPTKVKTSRQPSPFDREPTALPPQYEQSLERIARR
jgi:hypothetical protein